MPRSAAHEKETVEAGPLGLEHGAVRVVPYDRRWPSLFITMTSQLRAKLADRVLDIEHVGSTAVPGLSAKPILDILIGVARFDEALRLVPVVGELGFEHRPHEEIPDRHYFRRLEGGRSTHHLSLAEPDSRFYRRTLAFRDALRRNPGLRDEYEALKRGLAEMYPADRERYLDGKTDFVLGVLARRGLVV